MPARLDKALSDPARSRNSSRSGPFREALDARSRGKRRSVTAAVAEAVATVAGPADLSTNRERLSSYGK